MVIAYLLLFVSIVLACVFLSELGIGDIFIGVFFGFCIVSLFYLVSSIKTLEREMKNRLKYELIQEPVYRKIK